MTFVQRIENFWYYHKNHLLIAAVFIAALLIGTYSCVVKPQVDMYVLYVSTGEINQRAVRSLAEKLEQYTEDITGDNKTHVQMITVTFSEAMDRTAQDTVLAQYVTAVGSGEAIFYVFDDANYQEMQQREVLKPIAQINDLRYNATRSGFLEDIDWYNRATKPFYFGLRVAGGITEQDPRYPQILQAEKTMTKILAEYPNK